MCCDVGQDFYILCYFAPNEVQLSAMWFILNIVNSSFTNYGSSGALLPRDVLGDAHDPIDCGEDYNYTWNAPLPHHHCNP